MNVIDFFCSQTNDGLFDIVIDSVFRCFKYVSSFETAFYFQLFIDRRTSKYEIQNARERGGWLADIVTKQNNYEAGGKVYLKNQSRNTQNDLNEMLAFVKDALQYFPQQGYAKKVSASLNGVNIIGTIITNAGDHNNYTALWQAVGISNP